MFTSYNTLWQAFHTNSWRASHQTVFLASDVYERT